MGAVMPVLPVFSLKTSLNDWVVDLKLTVDNSFCSKEDSHCGFHGNCCTLVPHCFIKIRKLMSGGVRVRKDYVAAVAVARY